MFVIAVMMYQWCLLDNIAILNIHGGDYCCTINELSKREARNLSENANLTKKIGL